MPVFTLLPILRIMGSLPELSKSSPSYPPFDNAGTLDDVKQVHVTPCLGSEFKDVDVTEWLRAPNSDDILRDLALTSERQHFSNQQCIAS